MGPNYYKPEYINVWREFLKTPVKNSRYLEIYDFEMFQSSYLYVISIYGVILIILILINSLFSKSIISELKEKKSFNYIKYLNPTEWLIHGNSRSLGIIFIFLVCISWIGWCIISIRINYYEISPSSWNYSHNYIVIMDGSQKEIEKIRRKIYDINDEDSIKSWNRWKNIIGKIPLNQRELPSEIQKLDLNLFIGEKIKSKKEERWFYNAKYNPIEKRPLYLENGKPMILLNREIFARKIPKIYYPNLEYWRNSSISSFLETIMNSLTTSAIFVCYSSLPPTLTAFYGYEVVGAKWNVGCLGYGLLRISFYSIFDLFRQEGGLYKKKKKRSSDYDENFEILNETTDKTFDYFTPYKSLREEQNKVNMKYLMAKNQLKLEDPQTYQDLFFEEENIKSKIPNPEIPAWFIGLLKLYFCALERLILFFITIYILWNILKAYSNTKGNNYNKDHRNFCEKINFLFNELEHENSNSDLISTFNNFQNIEVWKKEKKPIYMLLLAFFLFIEVFTLLSIGLIYLVKPEGSIMMENPLIQDFTGFLFLECNFFILILCIKIILPKGSIISLPEYLKEMGISEFVRIEKIKIADKESGREIIDSDERKDESILGSLDKEKKANYSPIAYEIPEDYPLPSWIKNDIMEKRPKLISERLEHKGANVDLERPKLPLINIKVSIQSLEMDPLLPICSSDTSN